MVAGIERILKESLTILVLCATGGVIAGLLLHDMEGEVAKVPGVLVLLPAILGLRGNISGVLGSRLASALHLGLIDAELKWNKPLADNIYASMILNVVMSFLLGIIAYCAYIFAGFSESVSILQLTLISLITGTFAGIILTVLTVYLSIVTFAKGFDPDNILMPSLSTVGDIITVLCLLAAIKFVGFIPFI